MRIYPLPSLGRFDAAEGVGVTFEEDVGVPTRGLEPAEFGGEFAAALGGAEVGGKFGQAVLALDNAMGGEPFKLVVGGLMCNGPSFQPHRTRGTINHTGARIPHDKMGGEG